MDWWRCYHGMPEDAKLRLVASRANVQLGHVLAIWTTLLDHASRTRPRGSVESADPEAIAANLGWEPGLVQAVITALEQGKHIVDGQLRTWADRNPTKLDRTANERQKRRREKLKQTAGPTPKGAGELPEEHAMSRHVTPVTGVSCPVTPTEEIEQSSSSDEALRQETNSPLKQQTPRTVRAQASAIITAGAFWQWLAAQGIPAHIGTRTINHGRLADWRQRGLSGETLDEAMHRARESRRRERNSRPVNLGFLACFIDEVLDGIESPTKSGGGYGRGDQLGREFAGIR